MTIKILSLFAFAILGFSAAVAQEEAELSPEIERAIGIIYEDAQVSRREASAIFSSWLYKNQSNLEIALLASACADLKFVKADLKAMEVGSSDEEIESLRAEAMEMGKAVSAYESALHKAALELTPRMEIRQSIIVAEMAVSRLDSFSAGFRYGTELYSVERGNGFSTNCSK
ncbi:hypothetical protein [Sneathiella sp.]|uniref:hypothetical protein n=1 Tax=Sneathiella sp. TaxID=1964365 RepID=UPI0035620CB6